MIIVYGRRNSSNVQRVLWALDELGLAYDTVTVGGSFGGTDTPEYRAMNPVGVVPTLKDGGLSVWDSDAILRYLAARYGAGGPLWPEAPAARARSDSWMIWLALHLGPAINPVFHGTVRRPRAEQDMAALAPAVATLNERFAFVDAGLRAAPYLSGDGFGMADIPAAIWAYRFFNMAIERRPLPALEAWFERVAERPGFQAHVKVEMGTCLEEWHALERALV